MDDEIDDVDYEDIDDLAFYDHVEFAQQPDELDIEMEPLDLLYDY